MRRLKQRKTKEQRRAEREEKIRRGILKPRKTKEQRRSEREEKVRRGLLLPRKKKEERKRDREERKLLGITYQEQTNRKRIELGIPPRKIRKIGKLRNRKKKLKISLQFITSKLIAVTCIPVDARVYSIVKQVKGHIFHPQYKLLCFPFDVQNHVVS